jgi:hypothetical protein
VDGDGLITILLQQSLGTPSSKGSPSLKRKAMQKPGVLRFDAERTVQLSVAYEATCGARASARHSQKREFIL